MLLFLNKGIYRDKYEDEYVPWNKKTREEKALLIMRYVDSIELEQIKNEIFVKMLILENLFQNHVMNYTQMDI